MITVWKIQLVILLLSHLLLMPATSLTKPSSRLAQSLCHPGSEGSQDASHILTLSGIETRNSWALALVYLRA
jgi:hypothetical protein